MANHIESLSHLIITFAGTPASGLVKFVVDSFGSGKEMSESQAEGLIKIPGEEEDDREEEDSGVLTSAAVTIPDVCSLAESKPAYPVTSLLISSTGVPPNLYSENMPMGPSKRSTYCCLYGEPCEIYTHQKASVMAHLRQKHLGFSVAC